jgi:hypothetical protein
VAARGHRILDREREPGDSTDESGALGVVGVDLLEHEVGPAGREQGVARTGGAVLEAEAAGLEAVRERDVVGEHPHRLDRPDP